MSAPDDINDDELIQRVIYALLRPPTRIAARFGVSLKSIATLAQTAYFQELRNSGLTLDEAAERLGVSRRTAARLSSQLKKRFLVPEVAHNLPRRLEFMLAAQPMSAARLKQIVRDVEPAEIDAALETLVNEERIELLAGRTPVYQPKSALRKLARDTWVRRVGGLTSFAENLADAAYGRFFAGHPASFARTLSFRAPEGAHKELEKFYEESVIARVVELNEELESEEDGERLQFSICWAPYELVRETDASDEDSSDE